MKVVTVDCEDYDLCGKAVHSLCRQAGLDVGDSVLVKPNLLMPAAPERAITTHPEVVRAMLRELEGKDVVVAESSGGRNTARTELAFRKSGVLAVCEEEGVEAVNLDKERKKRRIGEFYVPEVVMERDVISLAKLKTHNLTGYTGAVKNLFGCLPGAQKWQMHQRHPEIDSFVEMLFQLHGIIQPKFSLIDGVFGMEGDGPSNGTPKRAGLLIGSRDAVACDVVAARTIGVPYPREAEVESVGEKKVKFKSQVGKFALLPAPVRKLLSGLVWMRPEVDKSKCKRCGVCAENCPVGAITLSPYPEIDREKCINCFCCHELCPYQAMEVERSFLSRFF